MVQRLNGMDLPRRVDDPATDQNFRFVLDQANTSRARLDAFGTLITGFFISYSVLNKIVVTALAVFDVTDIYVTASEDTEPRDPTADDNDGHIEGPHGSVDTGITGRKGHLTIIKMVAIQNGKPGKIRRVSVRRALDSVVEPSWELIPTENGITFTVTDPDLRIVEDSLTFAIKDNIGEFGSYDDAWDASTGTIGVDVNLVRTKAVTRLPYHLVMIKVHFDWVTIDDITLPVGTSHTFDLVSNAVIMSEHVSFDASGYPLVHLEGSGDTANMYFAFAQGSDPGTPDTGDFHIAGRTGSLQTSGALAIDEGAECWLRAIGYDADGVPGLVSGIVKVRRDTSTVTRRPTFNLDYDQSGSTGTATLTVFDPDFIATEPAFVLKIGAAAWDSSPRTDWDSSTGALGVDTILVRTIAVDIDPTHNSSINCFIGDGLDAGVPQTVGHTFDIDTIADVESCPIDFDPDTGEALIEPRGDEDCVNMYALVGSSDPGTPDSGGIHIAGHFAGQIATGHMAVLGEEVFVEVIGINADSVYGPPQLFRRIRQTGDADSQSQVRAASFLFTGFSSLSPQFDWSYAVSLGPGDYAVATVYEYTEIDEGDPDDPVPHLDPYEQVGTSGTYTSTYIREVPGTTVYFWLAVQVFDSGDVLVTDRTTPQVAIAKLTPGS